MDILRFHFLAELESSEETAPTMPVSALNSEYDYMVEWCLLCSTTTYGNQESGRERDKSSLEVWDGNRGGEWDCKSGSGMGMEDDTEGDEAKD